MRWVWLVTVIFGTGCSCDFELFPPDECSADSDCPDHPEGFCRGVGRCVGIWSSACVIREPECFEGYCDVVSNSCRECTSVHDAPECVWLFDGGADGGTLDAAFRFCGEGLPGEVIGAACRADGCEPGLDCLPEVTAAVGPVERPFARLCSPACDPGATATGCEPCAASCVDAVRVGRARVAVAELGRAPFCAVQCEPSRSTTGCSRPGFSCDVVTGTCQDGCRDDEECRLVRDASGELVLDAAETGVCDRQTGRCRMPGTPDARIGGPCSADADCTVDGVCIRGEGWPAAGYCARLDCQWPELGCGPGEQCHRRALERPACLVACTVGVEPVDERIGVGGHGAGCAPGLSCRWDGASADVSPNGGCVPGNYNDVLAPNLGAPCAEDGECHSPYGLGRCVFSGDGLGVCTLLDCGGAHPGIACGDGFSCARVGVETLCLSTCSTALDCAAGRACAPSSSGARVCAPSCTADGDCRDGERCEGTGCTFAGACRCVVPPG